MNHDTIAAIATGMTNSGIGIVRISGSEAFSIIDKIYKTKKNKLLSQAESHTIHYGYIYDDDELVDEVMVSVMHAPRTYTGEDTVEINCHGGLFIVQKVLETVLKHGARMAEPGEFSKRGFLNGKMDLSKAEAVMDLIYSKSEYAYKNSLNQLKGNLLEKIKSCREKIIYEIAFIESALDDPEHIDITGYSEKLQVTVKKLEAEIRKLIASSRNGKIIKEGIKTVILGKPNAGKSSLLNVLLGEERAIVTDIEGTTRDVLEESVNLGGIKLVIMDTAGIRATKDVVEKIGVEKAKDYAKEADFIMYVVDSSKPLDENDEEICDLLRDKKSLVLLNKMDLTSVITEKEMQEKTGSEVISISAKENLGIDNLAEKVKEMFLQGEIDFNEDIMITNLRHKNLLEQALESLKMVEQSIENNMPEDFYSIDLMSAYTSLGYIIGEEVEEDLVNEIFSKFCMGK